MESIQTPPGRAISGWPARRALVLVAALLVGCAAAPASKAAYPPLPFKTVTEALAAADTTVALSCPQGPVFGVMQRGAHAQWNLFISGDGTRFIFVQLVDSLVYYGTISEGALIAREVLPLAEAQAKRPVPCESLFPAGKP